jgi:uncharacterized membrane protein YgcG
MKFLLVILVLAIIAFVVYKLIKSKSSKATKVQASVYSAPHTYSGSTYVTQPRQAVTRKHPVVEKPKRREDDSMVPVVDGYDDVSEPADFGYWGADSGYSEPDRSSSYEAPSSSSSDSESSYSSGSSDSGSSSSNYSSDSGSSSSSSDSGSSYSSGSSDY